MKWSELYSAQNSSVKGHSKQLQSLKDQQQVQLFDQYVSFDDVEIREESQEQDETQSVELNMQDFKRKFPLK